MTVYNIVELLKGNAYPGRGIVLGAGADGKSTVCAYFIMGRSQNSRNRIFTRTEDGIRTEAFDPSRMTDPSLIIYRPVRVFDGHFIVTNGDQTDTIRNALTEGKSFEYALGSRRFEPDAPNYTPRVSGIVYPCGGYKLSILKSAGGDPRSCQRMFFNYPEPVPGLGYFISTYICGGDPLPSFEGEPRCVGIPDNPAEFAEAVWDSLDANNRVSLYVCRIDRDGGVTGQYIINKNEVAL